MTSNKRIKRIKAIDSFDFELFVRAHLSTDLADTLILKLGIRTYNGFIECEHFQEELLAVYNSMNEKDKQNLFLYDTSSSLSTPTQVKPGILREFNIFRQECKIYVNNQKNNDINSGNSSSTQGELGSLDRSKRFKSSSKIYRSIMGTIACNNKDDEEKFNFRQTYYSKPTMNDDNNLTDWSFNQEDVFDYNTISNDNKIFDQFMIQEASHIYITQQRLYHFFQKRMAIKSQDIHKFIFQLQSTLEWHLEQLYEFTMKTRITKLLFDSFVNSFKKSILENGEDLINKVHWLVNYIKESNYKPSGYSHSLD